MAWTTLSFAFGSVLTSAKMTQMYDNFAAFAAKDTGAPVLGNDYIVNAMMATNSVNADSIAADSVNSSELISNSVKSAEVGFVAGTSYAGSINAGVEAYFTLHNLSFFPMIHTTHEQVFVNGHNVDGVNGGAPRFGIRNESSGAADYDVDYYYVGV